MKNKHSTTSFIFPSTEIYTKISHCTRNTKTTASFTHSVQRKILKVQSCKLYNNICIIASTQITNIKMFAFIVVPVFTLFEPSSFIYKQKGQ